MRGKLSKIARMMLSALIVIEVSYHTHILMLCIIMFVH